MRLIISNLKLPIEHSEEDILKQCASRLRTKADKLSNLCIKHKSIDARDKSDIRFIYSVTVDVSNGEQFLSNKKIKNIAKADMSVYEIKPASYKGRPVIIGAGPAGLFCAYRCVLAGLKPIVLERGSKVDVRTEDIKKFWETGVLDIDSNVSFGEGGAGTFSDGKLNTVVKDKNHRCSFVMESFVKFGAPENILYDSKPHVGTDILVDVVRNMRLFIEEHGGDIHFNTKCIGFTAKGGSISSVIYRDSDDENEIAADHVVLAIGHSARDTFEVLDKSGIYMSPKPFAVGFRVEHPRRFIDFSQYGPACDNDNLRSAPYKLTAQTSTGRGVYSFCMCPGGYVVNASTEKGGLVVNGMSYSKRDASNSNTALIVTVNPEDYGATDTLSGVRFQRELERKAYELGKSNIPAQNFGDYYKAITGNNKDIGAYTQYDRFYDDYKSCTKGNTYSADLSELMPAELNVSMIEAMERFGRIIKGYDDPRVILSGIESRTSSPVRIWRDDDGCSPSLSGLYPCGEGAGYAGGITSAAMDGLYIAELICK